MNWRDAAVPTCQIARVSYPIVMFQRTDDLRITETRPLIPPAILLEEIPISETASKIGRAHV